MSADDRLLPPREAAEYLGVGLIALRDWRYRRIGPPYIRLGHRTVRYRKSDLDAWLERQRVVMGSGE